ncbi:anti-sigma factor [Pedobacter punctiformis]|uniref:Regulator of SigK n=1 Tax=Pedobacter punctiformis TaxID=3004097 RepID=A0ABT4L3Y2_9SPHI|nr:anti-sigma factor [Pedobacter sp. HCMS5-2]MCZ4242617.1 anti-sigma factor [Pedobacter sp. HCMS5-2]
MENLKAYIESGVLELYVLGDLSPEEAAQVEEMAALHPEVRTELASIEEAMEQYAIQNAVDPSANVETKLLDVLGLNPEEEKIKIPVAAEEPKIIQLDTNNSKIKTLRYALVACVALLVVSIAALFVTYNKLTAAHNEIVSLNIDKQKFASNASKMEFENAGLENMIAMHDSKEWATIKLQGVKTSPSSKMMVYWNKENKSVLINYAAMDLPKTDESHEYQLWALVNGKPVSLGVFGSDDRAKEALVKMQTIEEAQAFAVTIEPMGGSINPTMEKMLVMGGV